MNDISDSCYNANRRHNLQLMQGSRDIPNSCCETLASRDRQTQRERDLCSLASISLSLKSLFFLKKTQLRTNFSIDFVIIKLKTINIYGGSESDMAWSARDYVRQCRSSIVLLLYLHIAMPCMTRVLDDGENIES